MLKIDEDKLNLTLQSKEEILYILYEAAKDIADVQLVDECDDLAFVDDLSVSFRQAVLWHLKMKRRDPNVFKLGFSTYQDGRFKYDEINDW